MNKRFKYNVYFIFVVVALQIIKTSEVGRQSVSSGHPFQQSKATPSSITYLITSSLRFRYKLTRSANAWWQSIFRRAHVTNSINILNHQQFVIWTTEPPPHPRWNIAASQLLSSQCDINWKRDKSLKTFQWDISIAASRCTFVLREHVYRFRAFEMVSICKESTLGVYV